MKNFFKNFFMSEDERFLSKSNNLADFEHRQRILDRREAPHQRVTNGILFTYKT